jgi:peptidoglycan hydrolase-like protein with peptidoglycan-binding domain
MTTTTGFTRNGSMTIGARGALVTRAQQQLEAAGFELGEPDGIFGNRTKAAVEAFQRRMGLTVDGMIGRETSARLRTAGGDAFQDRPVQPPTNTNTTTPTAAGRVRTPAELRQLNNTRVNTQLPDRGPGYQGYYAGNRRYGTERTVETIKTVAANYNAATGQTLRVGDISLRGGGDIDGHASHTNGRNVDIDMAFSDGRTDIERNRNSVNATWRSPHYDRAATRRLVQEIKRANPNIQVLFNDPVLAREGLVRPYPNHDNHLHLQNMN